MPIFEKLSPDHLGEIVDDLIEYENPVALAARLVTRYQITPEKAEALTDVTLEDGYMSFSRKAISKLLPLLDAGHCLATLTDKDWQGIVS